MDIEAMGHDPRVYTRYIIMAPYKHILILLGELDQSLVELEIEKKTNVDYSVRELVI